MRSVPPLFCASAGTAAKETATLAATPASASFKAILLLPELPPPTTGTGLIIVFGYASRGVAGEQAPRFGLCARARRGGARRGALFHDKRVNHGDALTLGVHDNGIKIDFANLLGEVLRQHTQTHHGIDEGVDVACRPTPVRLQESSALQPKDELSGGRVR